MADLSLEAVDLGPDLAADQATRRAAQQVFARPLLIEAGAGTGKTTTLVARVLAWSLGPGWERARERRSRAGSAAPVRLIEDTEAGRERLAAAVLGGVVAITFTEAAAAEMAARAARDLAALAEAGELPSWLDPAGLPEAGERARRARALLGTLDHLVVRTIHAFCRSLLAAYPMEAGRHPMLTVDADGRALEAVVHEVVEGSLREGYGEPGDPDLLALAARGFGPPQIVEALTVLAREGLPAAALAEDPLGPGPTATLAARLATASAALHRPLAARLRFGGSRRKGIVPALAQGLGLLLGRLETKEQPPDLATLRGWIAEDLPANAPARLRAWGKGKLASQAERELVGDLLPELAPAAAALGRLLEHLGRLDPDLLGAARRGLQPLLARVEGEMRSRGAETFEGLLRGAADLLARHAEVRARVRRGIDQLLVDEFQDTDRLQCEILRWLALDGPAEGRPGLFLVGDPKQSIYGWRGADLAAYDGFAALVREAGGEVLPLVENFRSVPPILEEVGRAIAPVMRERLGVQPRFEALLPCAERREDAGYREAGRRPLEYWISWRAESGAETRPGEAAELEAAALAHDVADLHGRCGVAFREIGVLLRSTTELDVYLEALRRARIPFRVGRDRQYYRRREVIEAAALVRAVADPGDHLALLTVLRSPVAGVPDAALIPLWRHKLPRLATDLARPAPERLAALAEAVREAARELPEGVPGLAALAGWEEGLLAALEHLAVLRASFAADPADLFVEKLRRLLLPEPVEAARYLGPYRLANLERFFRRLLAALEEQGGDAAAVLRLLRQGVASGEEAEEGRPQEGGEDEVSVLTMHGAKGLDFEHVYLLQLHKQSREGGAGGTEVGPRSGFPAADRESPQREKPREYRLFGAATAGFDEVEAERADVEAAERVRTLYVAMTRAKRRLVLAGAWPASGEPVSPERARTHADLLAGRPALPGAGREGGLAALWDELRSAGEGGANAAGAALDELGVLWRFPGLDPALDPAAGPRWEESVEGQGGEPALPGVAELRQEADELRRRRAAADRQRSRRRSRPASEEAHERLRHLAAARRLGPEEAAGGEAPERPETTDETGERPRIAGESWEGPGDLERLQAPGDAPERRDTPGDAPERREAPGDAPERRTPSASFREHSQAPESFRERSEALREAALAAGGAVHRALETWDLVADPKQELARQRDLLPAYLAALSAGEADRALRRARALLDRFAAGPLLPRLRDLAGEVLARELPVLLPPDGDPGAPMGFIAGTIDLLYRGAAGELVVADYKTDDIEEEADLAARAAAYAYQGAAYVRAVREALALPAPPRFELWFLRPGRVVPVELPFD